MTTLDAIRIIARDIGKTRVLRSFNGENGVFEADLACRHIVFTEDQLTDGAPYTCGACTNSPHAIALRLLAEEVKP